DCDPVIALLPGDRDVVAEIADFQLRKLVGGALDLLEQHDVGANFFSQSRTFGNLALTELTFQDAILTMLPLEMKKGPPGDGPIPSTARSEIQPTAKDEPQPQEEDAFGLLIAK